MIMVVGSRRRKGGIWFGIGGLRKDQEGFTGSMTDYITGITASKDPEIYNWLLLL